jgi:hypothetical protein
MKIHCTLLVSLLGVMLCSGGQAYRLVLVYHDHTRTQFCVCHRGAKHEAISSVNSAGMPSYTMVRVYRPSHGSSYTSIACSLLGAAAFIRVPSTHILFSFAASSGSILRLDITTDAAHPFELVTLCPLSSAVMQGLRTRVNQVAECVRGLQRSRKSTSAMDTESEESDTSDLT